MKNRNLVVGMFALGFGVSGAALMADPPSETVPAPTIESKPTTTAQPGKPSKPAKAEKPKLYDEAADAKAQIAAALAKAKKENRRVLVQWGGNWCGWCIKLNDLMTSDAALKKELLYEYDVVHVDAGQPAGKNIDLAEKYGADLKKNGFPFLTILDADGKAIANQETSSLEKKDANGESILGDGMGHDAKKVMAFLKANEAKPLVAEAVVANGIAEARQSGKVVFVHFGAPWCVWCHRLEDWMARPEIAAVLAKNFVDVKVDVDRMTGGKAEKAKYCKNEGGIPWFVFLSAEGATLASSDGPKGNVGFPGEAGEIAHFGEMLSKACPKMSDADRKTLLDSLKPKDKAVGAATTPADGAGH